MPISNRARSLNPDDSRRRYSPDAYLAQDQEHLLRPATLRRDYVFRLAAELTAAVLNLEVGDEEDPLKALDARQPGWHRTMPIDLHYERARKLVRELIQGAARYAPGTASGSCPFAFAH